MTADHCTESEVALQAAVSGKRSKKTSTRKSDDKIKVDPETPKSVAKEVPAETTKGDSTSEDDVPANRRPFDEEDEDSGLPNPFQGTLLGSGHSRASMAETLRQLSGYTPGVSQRVRDDLSNLRQKDDPSLQLIALQDLSELLLISNEENLSGHFSPDQVVKELIALMQPNDFGQENPEMMLLACRCMANLMEALPASTAVVVYSGAVPLLCQKLLEIDFIDLAEQALSTLEKISAEFPSSIVKEGGLSACLNFLDFFATSTQRTAVTTAANCCKNIPQDSFAVVSDVMPTLLNVLSNSDQKVVEQGSICVSRIVESFKYEHDKLEALISVELLKAIRRLLQPGTTNLIGPNIHTQFLRVLSITAQASPKLSAELLKMDVVDTLYQILTGVSPPTGLENVASQIDSVFIMQALIHRPREQISETLNVVCELLPPVHSESLDSIDISPDIACSDDDIVPYSSSDTMTAADKDRMKTMETCKEELKRFAIVMFPTLTDAFSSTVNLGVRQKVLTAQLKMLSNLDVGILEESLRTVPYASFLASILSQQDHPSLVASALQAADLLLRRLLSIYGYQFYREGVMAEVALLASETVTQTEHKAQGAKPSDSDVVMAGASTHAENLEPDDTVKTSDDVAVANEEDVDVEGDEDEDDAHDDHGDGQDGDHGEDDDEEQIAIRDEVSPSPSETSSDQDYAAHARTSEKDLNILAARRFLEAHETDKSRSMKDQASKILKQLQSLAKAISRHYNGDGQGSGPQLFTQLSEYFHGDALSTVTSAELFQSEIVDALLGIFSDRQGRACVSKRHAEHELKRVADGLQSAAKSDFLQVFMKIPPLTSNSQAQSTPFSVFIHKLQDLLSRAEHFEVVTVHQNAFDNSRSSPSSMLSKQLRLKLTSEDQPDIARACNNITISLHAIATFKSLDEYLRPRIILAERPRGSKHREGVSNALAAFAAASGRSSPHPRLGGRAAGASDPNPVSNSPDSTPLSRTGRKTSKYRRDYVASEPTHASEKPSTSKRASRRNPPAAAHAQESPHPPPERIQTPLECADERALTDDDDDLEDSGALEAIVDDLDDSMDNEQAPEPTAVNMEVASTGKVTARQDDGTRVATPSHDSSVPHPQRTPSSLHRELAASMSLSAERNRAMSYAAAIQSIPQDWHVEFNMYGRHIPHGTTVYRAVHHNDLQAGSTPARNIWSAIHTVKFKRVPGPPPPETSLTSPSSSAITKEDSSSSLPGSLHEHPQTSKILRLLNIFHEVNSNVDDVLDDSGEEIVLVNAEPLSQFVNTKLTAKLNRQLEEPLVVASRCLPTWSEDLARLYPFLFPFETRHLFLQSTSFGYSRSMTRWQNQSTEDSRRDRHRDDRPFQGKLLRQKVRISRSRILESACKVMEIYGGSSSILEIEYFDEVGTGLGPTLEFYSTVSKEFSKSKTKMWRTNDGDEKEEYAFGKSGMFPAPMTEAFAESENGKRILNYFKMLGKFIARSMLDSRIIDVSLNPIFFRIGNQPSSVPLSLGAAKKVDSHLAQSLKLLKQYANVKIEIDNNAKLSSAQKAREIKGASIADLGLDFTLPGYSNIELVHNGANTAVTLDNVALYVEKVIDMTLGSGVRRQTDQFRTGFSEVFSYSALKAFTPSELVMLFGRVEEDWSIESESGFLNIGDCMC